MLERLNILFLTLFALILAGAGLFIYLDSSREQHLVIAAGAKSSEGFQLVYSPLAQGVLTGKYLPNEPPPSDSRAANREIGPNSKRFEDPSLLAAVQRLRPIAKRPSLSMSQLALAWVLRDSRVSSAIIGASRPEQIEENIAAVGVELDDTTLREIDEVIVGVARR